MASTNGYGHEVDTQAKNTSAKSKARNELHALPNVQ